MDIGKPKATMKREAGHPFRWILTMDITSEKIDRDRYQHDLMARWSDKYEITKIGE